MAGDMLREAPTRLQLIGSLLVLMVLVVLVGFLIHATAHPPQPCQIPPTVGATHFKSGGCA